LFVSGFYFLYRFAVVEIFHNKGTHFFMLLKRTGV